MRIYTLGSTAFAVLTATVTLLFEAGIAPAAPIVEYLFNETGTDAVDSGTTGADLAMTQWDGATWNSADNHGASGSGVSASSGDRSYSDPSVVLDSGHFSGGFASADVNELKTLSQMTVQGWFKTPTGEPIGEGESGILGNLGSSTNDGGWAIRTRSSASSLHSRLSFWVGEVASSSNHAIRLTSDQVFTETDEWVFFALTFTASDGAVQFYKGTTSSAVAAAGTNSSGALIGSAITAPNQDFYVGNLGSEGGAFFQARAFNGELDNIRVFDSVLSSSELETLRQGDLAIVPEPSTLAMFLVMTAFVSTIRRRNW